jgi:hypothetical protein
MVSSSVQQYPSVFIVYLLFFCSDIQRYIFSYPTGVIILLMRLFYLAFSVHFAGCFRVCSLFVLLGEHRCILLEYYCYLVKLAIP